ncbi:esterase-like activity of phytase family protein [Pseudooceanicola aestuarii]|uniref:esterase-like activity of phytase family protein n=1 Tax=Pseudooceanicola aestuarii TaxID=2697319 RepID=UPI0013D362BF|nr:esterase-like activity of phytase family protein [Pseudooceanicola aestuarii]
MRFRPAIALILCLVPSCDAPPAGWRLSEVAAEQRDNRIPLGGLSAIEVSADGSTFVALTDRGQVVEGRLERNAGELAALRVARLRQLDDDGGTLIHEFKIDSEGLAIGPHGTRHISFEGPARVYRDGATLDRLPDPPDHAALEDNTGYEALAVDAQGRLLTLAEQSRDTDFPLFRYENGAWSRIARIQREGRYRPVGADVGPDGQFYLLERSFFFGFRNRVRRFDLTAPADAPRPGTIIWHGDSGLNRNLEGLAVWHDGAGALRLTMVADDNFMALLRNVVTEVTLASPAPEE